MTLMDLEVMIIGKNKFMSRITKILLGLSIVFLLITICLFFIDQVNKTGPFLILFFLFLALGIRGVDRFKGLSFTVLIFAAVSLSMYYPQSFVQVGDFQLKKLIVPLLQVIMFGMGTAMSFNDFYGVIKMPKGVFVGLICQFSIRIYPCYSLRFSC
jgi:BASS family bile acid:Na+ symporter